MAYQNFYPQWKEFVLDLHGVRTQDARRAILMRIEECCRYGIPALKIIYGTPDWYKGSIAEALYRLVGKHPRVVQELLPSQFVLDAEEFSRRTGWIKLYLTPDADPLPQNAHMRFSPFTAEREPDRWSRTQCERHYFPLKEGMTLEEAAVYIGEGCTLQYLRECASRLAADTGQAGPGSGQSQIVSSSSLRAIAESWWACARAGRQPEMKEAEAAPEPTPVVGDESVFDEDALWAAIEGQEECFKAGRFAQAEGYLLRALKLVRPFPSQLEARIATLSGLTRLYEAQSRYAEAEHYYSALLEAIEGDPASDRLLFHLALLGLARVCAAQQRRAEALEAAERFVASVEAVRDVTDEDLLAALAEAALLCEKLGRHEVADAALKKALSLQTQRGTSPQLRVLLLRRHAYLCLKHQMFPQAAASLEEAVGLAEQAFEIEDPGLWRLRSLLADVQCILGQYSAAEQLLQTLLRTEESRQEPDLTAIACTLEALGKIHLSQERHAEAEQAYRRALDFSRRAGDHSSTIRITGRLAELLQLLNHCSEAEKMYRDVLESAERLHGPDHPDVATIARGLASLLFQAGRLQEAETLFERALLIGEVELGAEHPAVAVTLSEFAVLRYDQGLYQEAEQTWKRALAIRRKWLGEKHPDCALVLLSLALVYSRYADYRQARDALEEALEIQEHAFGRDHPELLPTLSGLAYAFTMMGQNKAAGRIDRRIRDLQKLHPPRDGVHPSRS